MGTHLSRLTSNLQKKMSDHSVLDPPVLEFKPEYFTSQFEKCAESEDIDLAEFIQGFEGLVLLLNRLGSVFSFITVDIVQKIGLLREKRNENALLVHEKNCCKRLRRESQSNGR